MKYVSSRNPPCAAPYRGAGFSEVVIGGFVFFIFDLIGIINAFYRRTKEIGRGSLSLV